MNSEDGRSPALRWLAAYYLLGLLFGVVLVQSEAVSWFRIQEMFRLQSFHLYGIFVGALAVGIPSVAFLKRSGLRSAEGEPVRVPPKEMGRGYRYCFGGFLFGVGLALTGACPGPLFALVGYGVWVMLSVVASALLGAWVYGRLRPHLPHY